MDDRPSFGSMFSGIGGIDLGLERAGWRCAWQAEIDPEANRILERRFPDVPRYGDIRLVDWRSVERVDAIVGGFPCQPVSVAGRGLAQADPRWLWPAFADVIALLRPRLVLVENVPGLLQRGLGDVLGDLVRLGYDAERDRLAALDVGAPHLRNRLFVVGIRKRPEQRRALADGDDGRP